MAIFVLVLWLATAVAGFTLLRAGGAARREAAIAEQPQPVPVPVRIGAIPLTPEGKPPPGPHTRVQTPPGEHPLLEFSHPTLAVAGIACWTMFTFVHYRPLAWIAFAILVVTLLAGLSWLVLSRRAAQHDTPGTWRFPARLVLTHGVVAACSLVLTVLSALTAASH